MFSFKRFLSVIFSIYRSAKKMEQLLKRDHDYEKISDISCKGCDTMNVMKKYWDTVYLCQLLLAPLSCLCAGIYYTLCRLYGQYIQAPWPYVILFDCSQILYLVIAILLLLQRNHIDRLPGREQCAAEGSGYCHGVSELCAVSA